MEKINCFSCWCVNQENRIRLMLAVANDAVQKRRQQELLIAQDEALAGKTCSGDCETCDQAAKAG